MENQLSPWAHAQQPESFVVYSLTGWEVLINYSEYTEETQWIDVLLCLTVLFQASYLCGLD